MGHAQLFTAHFLCGKYVVTLVSDGAETGRHVVLGQFVAAAGAEQIRGAHGSVAVAATGRELIVALRAEVELALDMGSAGRAAGRDRQAKQEVKHSADSTGKGAEQHPEARAHRAARSVTAYVADHEEVERRQQAPGKVEVNPQAERRRRMVALGGHDDPPVVLDHGKRDACGHHGPHGNEPCIFVHRKVLRITHSSVTEE